MTDTLSKIADCRAEEHSARRTPHAAIPDEEQSLLAGLRAGDDGAFEVLVRRYGGPMHAVARRFLRCEEDSTDAVQDAFLSAFQALDSFEGSARLSTWLHRIVVNSCLMKLRSRARRPTVPLEELPPRFDESGHHARPGPPWGETALARLARAELGEQVRACIDRLSEPHRRVLLLRDIEELDTEQTAHLLGISCAAVKTRLHRARQALRSLLGPIVRTEEPAPGGSAGFP